MIAIVIKEVRENGKWAALVAAVVAVGLAWAVDRDSATGLSLVGTTMAIVTGVLFPAAGLAIGLLAVLPDARRGRWQFIMHRPIGRGRIFAAKAVAAVALYVVATAVPLVGAYAWLAVPGHVPGPVTPDLLVPRLADGVGGLTWLAAGLLVATRSARWVGSRLVPAGAALLVSLLAVTLSMTFGEFAATEGAAALVLAAAAAAAFVAGGDVPRTAWAGRSLAGVSLAAGWVVAVGFGAGLVEVVVEALGSGQTQQPAAYYQVLDDGRVAVVDPGQRLVGQRVKDLQGRPIPGERPDSHVLSSATLTLSSPRPADLVRLARVDAWGFHAAAGHLRPLALYGTGDPSNANWFEDVSRNALVGFDRVTRRSIGWLGPDGRSATPRPFPERLNGPTTFGRSWANPTDALILAGDRSVWQVDVNQGRVRRTFVAGDGNTVLSAGRFSDTGLGSPAASVGNTAVATRDAVYVAKDGRPFTRIAQADPTSTYYWVDVGRATDGRIVLDYQPRPATDGTVPPRRVVYASADGRSVQAIDLPPLPSGGEGVRWSDVALPAVAFPPALLSWLIEGDGPQHLQATAWAMAAAVGVLAAIVTVPLARRRWYRPAAVAAWALLNLLLGVPGVLLLLSTDDAEVTVPCPACGRGRPVSGPLCPHCAAAFPPPPAIGCEVFQAA